MSLSKMLRSGCAGGGSPAVVDLAGGQQRGDLDPQGFQDGRWQAGMGPPDEHGVCALGEHHGWCLPFDLADTWWLAFRHRINRSEQQ
jgi:hypothetical protein